MMGLRELTVASGSGAGIDLSAGEEIRISTPDGAQGGDFSFLGFDQAMTRNINGWERFGRPWLVFSADPGMHLCDGDGEAVMEVGECVGDGRNDIVWANMDGPARAYLNRTEGRFLSVRLPDTPQSIGARIKLEGVRAPVHTHIAGEGLTSDRSTQFSIGLPESGPVPTAIVIEWLDGRTTRTVAPQLNKTTVVAGP